MANYGYLSSLLSLFTSIFDFDSSQNPHKKIFCTNLLKCTISLLLVLTMGFILMKIYEVPVYYTKIDVISHKCVPVKGEELDIKIRRDYDRGDKNTIRPDSNTIFSGFIAIAGKYKCDSNYSSKNKTELNRIRNIIDEELRNKYEKPLSNPHFVSICINTTYRQEFRYKERFYKEKFVYSGPNRGFMITDGITKKTIDSPIDNNKRRALLLIQRSAPANNSSQSLYVDAVTQEDSAFFVANSFAILTLQKPSVIYTAEDVSKIVEIIDLGHSDSIKNSVMWNYAKSLTIDYVGPTEFSNQISPEPDSISLSSITYTSPWKIKEIGEKGLRIHAIFPDMQNIQEARIFIISGLLTGISALFLKYFYRIIVDIILYIKRRVKEKLNWKLYVLLFIIVITIVACIITLICSMISGAYIDPYNVQSTY